MVFLHCIFRGKKLFLDFLDIGDIDHFVIEINEIYEMDKNKYTKNL